MDKRELFKAEVEFRRSFDPMFEKIEVHLLQNHPNVKEANDLIDAIPEFQKKWEAFLHKLLINAEVEEGIFKSYHPLSRMSETMENYQKSIEARLKKLEEK